MFIFNILNINKYYIISAFLIKVLLIQRFWNATKCLLELKAFVEAGFFIVDKSCSKKMF